MAWVNRYRWVLLGVAVAIVVAGIAALMWWPDGEQEPRARAYRDYDLCLLTDSRGLAGDEAKQAWTALQQVSAQTDYVRVSFLEVMGPQTQERAGEYVATLVLQGCDIMVPVGELQVAAASSVVAQYPEVRFVLPAGGPQAANVTIVDDPARLAPLVRPLVPDED